MQRLLCMRLLAKKKLSTNITCYTSKANPIHPQNALVSHFSTTNSGFNFYGLLANQFSRNSSALFKAPTEGLGHFKRVFSRSYFLQKKSGLNVSSFKFFSQGRRWIQRLDSDHVVVGLIAANVVVFLLWRSADPRFMANNFMISLDNFKSGRVHTMITSAFSHMDAGHIISNMIGAVNNSTASITIVSETRISNNSGLISSPYLKERRIQDTMHSVNNKMIGSAFGPEFLLKLYLAGALAGSVFYLVYHAFLIPSKSNQVSGRSPSSIPGLGASGAVNAIMLLDIFLNPKKTIFFEMIIPVPAILVGIFLIGKDMLRIIEGDSRVSGSAHLGGAAVAALAWARYRRGRFY